MGLNEITLQRGRIDISPGHVIVDCSATAITNRKIKPIFEQQLITPQMVRSYQPVFSAALIAHVEVGDYELGEKNRLCGVVPLPDSDIDFLRFTAAFMMNQYHWSKDKALRRWLVGNRLDGFSRMVASISEDDIEKIELLQRLKSASKPAMANLQQLLSKVSATESTAPGASA